MELVKRFAASGERGEWLQKTTTHLSIEKDGGSLDDEVSGDECDRG